MAACQQKMADMPYHRPYTPNKLFENDQSARPLENGVVHRNQALDEDPLLKWLTADGKNVKPDPAWSALVDSPGSKTVPPPGAPTDVRNFVDAFPFEIGAADLKRGQVLYNANCALCHGGAGHANGKIPERGFLRPPSYHTDPAGHAKDWSTLGFDKATEKPAPNFSENPQGVSRGFYRYGVIATLAPHTGKQLEDFEKSYHLADQANLVPNRRPDDGAKTAKEVRTVPVGYVFQVITWGYGGMASHDTQIPDPADRWRVVAYVRALQLSQAAPAADVKDVDAEIAKSKAKAAQHNEQHKAGGNH